MFNGLIPDRIRLVVIGVQRHLQMLTEARPPDSVLLLLAFVHPYKSEASGALRQVAETTNCRRIMSRSLEPVGNFIKVEQVFVARPRPDDRELISVYEHFRHQKA